MSEDAILEAVRTAKPSLGDVVPGGGDLPAPDELAMAQFSLTDLGNARRMISRYGRDVIFSAWRGWFIWDGQRYRLDLDGAVARAIAHKVAGSIRAEIPPLKEWLHQQEIDAATAEDVPEKDKSGREYKRIVAHRRYAAASENTNKLSNMLTEAKVYLRTDEEDLDADPTRLASLNGTLHLSRDADKSTGSFVAKAEADRDDKITRCLGVAFDERANAPQWRAFLNVILPDDAMQTFLQRWFGYCLSGHTYEQKICIFHGSGGNGKSTMVETILRVMGDYALSVPVKNFIDDGNSKAGEATPDLVKLPGVRLVATAEPKKGASLDEGFIKLLTGGERMTVRGLFKDAFDFQPHFKLVLSTNPKPRISGQDDGIWRRILLVPFMASIAPEDQDPELPAKLWEERDGILAWMVSGWRDYCERGLDPPAEVLAATDEYREEGDPVGRFLKEWTLPCDEEFSLRATGANSMRQAYEEWCAKSEMIKPWSGTMFGRRLVELGLAKDRRGGVVYYHRVVLNEPVRDAALVNAMNEPTPDPRDRGEEID